MKMRALLAAAALLATAGAALAQSGVIRGQATPAPFDFKAGTTTLEVELRDVSQADAPAAPLASAAVPIRRMGPIPFVLSYDLGAIVAENSYAVSARLVQGGMLIQRSESPVPVLTQGGGRTVSLALTALATPEPVAETPPEGLPVADLVGDWRLTEAGGEAAAEGVRSSLTLTAGGEALGSGGCNSFRGTYVAGAGDLRFGPIAATRRACPAPQMDQETRLLAALEATQGFRIEGTALLLTDAAGTVVARFGR